MPIDMLLDEEISVVHVLWLNDGTSWHWYRKLEKKFGSFLGVPYLRTWSRISIHCLGNLWTDAVFQVTRIKCLVSWIWRFVRCFLWNDSKGMNANILRMSNGTYPYFGGFRHSLSVGIIFLLVGNISTNFIIFI